MRSLASALIEYGKITTTIARAKELRPYIEKLITKARTGDVHARRIVANRLGNNTKAVKKLVDDVAPQFKDRNGGYTRVVKLPRRDGDAAEMAVIEFVS